MPQASLQTLVCHLRRIVGAPPGPTPTDAELLERFVRERDGGAFELLVWRHQRMVFGVCQRVLRDSNDAEDAFQATFLSLVRKAGSISKRQALAGWLYQVAYRTACRAHAEGSRHASVERTGVDLSFAQDGHDDSAELAQRDLWPVLDRELHRLSAKYRDPLVLCYLEGKTYDEAAKQLGCPLGTLSTRLTRAREILRLRLTARGVALSTAALTVPLFSKTASAALVANTIQTVTHGSAVSAKVTALTQGVLQAMFLSKLKAVVGVTLVITILGAGGAALVPGGMPSAQAQIDDGPKMPLGSGQAKRDEPPGTWRLRAVIQAPAPAKPLALSPDGKVMATGGAAGKDGVVTFWDLASAKEIGVIAVNLGPVRLLEFSPDGRVLVTVSQRDEDSPGAITFWDVETRKILAVSNDVAGGVLVVNFSKDGRRLEAINGKGHWMVWEVSTGKLLADKVLAGAIETAAFSRDGKLLAATGRGEVGVRLWAGPKTGKQGKQLMQFASGQKLSTLVISPDGKSLALSGGDGKEVWVFIANLGTGETVRHLASQKDAVNSIAFSPDGKLLATGGQEKTVKLWDTASGKEVAALKGHESSVNVVIFSKDGTTLITASSDGTIRIWGASKAAPAAAAIPGRLDTLLQKLLKTKRSDEQILEALCLATLARLPTDIESNFMLQQVAAKKDRRQAFADVLWALVNSEEFRLNVEAFRRQVIDELLKVRLRAVAGERS